MNTLEQYLKEYPVLDIKHPTAYRCCVTGDIEVHLKHNNQYAKPIDANLVLYLDVDTNEVIGYRIVNPDVLIKRVDKAENNV